MRGIILAGGAGTRLYPVTSQVNKHFAPVYDKPMIYYPFSTLLLAGVDEFLIITRPEDATLFQNLFGSGDRFGVSISYAEQERPGGIAEAFIVGKDFVRGESVVLILGDNLFYGPDFGHTLAQYANPDGVHIFGAQVENPRAYGVIEFDEDGNVISIEEKPLQPRSHFAVPGLYFYAGDVVEQVKRIKPSARGELEISDLNQVYLDEGRLTATMLSRGNAWLDTGNVGSLHDAATFIRAVELRQGLKIGCPEEIAWRMGRLSSQQLASQIENMPTSDYRDYLNGLLHA